MVKQPPTLSQLAAHAYEVADEAVRRRGEPGAKALMVWVPSNENPADGVSRGKPGSASSDRPPRGTPLPEPRVAAFIGQDDTVVAPDEWDEVDMVVDLVAPMVLDREIAVADDVNPGESDSESAQLVSGMDAEMDPVEPDGRSHVAKKAREAEIEEQGQKARELRKAPSPGKGD